MRCAAELVAAREPEGKGIVRGADEVRLPRIARVLAATDLSELGNQALRHAYALLPLGGTVHLLHVVEEGSLPNPLYAHYTPGRRPTPAEQAAQEEALEAGMRALVPREAESRGIETSIEIVHASDPAEAIRDAAERLGVDAICMGTHGRTGLSSLVAGSVARQVASATARPLFLVRTPADDRGAPDGISRERQPGAA